MTNHTFEQFQNAWIDMNVKALESCLSSNVSYNAITSERILSGPIPILDHVANVFRYLKDNEASINITSMHSNKLNLLYVFEALWPVTHYMINSEGIFLVPCLEFRSITLKVNISTRIRNGKIQKIKIIEEKKVECNNTAL